MSSGLRLPHEKVLSMGPSAQHKKMKKYSNNAYPFAAKRYGSGADKKHFGMRSEGKGEDNPDRWVDREEKMETKPYRPRNEFRWKPQDMYIDHYKSGGWTPNYETFASGAKPKYTRAEALAKAKEMQAGIAAANAGVGISKKKKKKKQRGGADRPVVDYTPIKGEKLKFI